MATVNIEAPAAVMPSGSTGQVPQISFTAASHVKDGDFVALSGGSIVPAAANAATVAGLASHDSLAQYAGLVSGTIGANDLTNAFGYSNNGSPLVPAQARQTLVSALNAPAIVEINLSVLTGWVSGGTYQANVGTQVGLAIDSSGYFVADPNASNKVAIIIDKIEGPSFGGVGDLAGRVQVRMIASALSV